MRDDWTIEETWLRFDDVECFRCGRWCGPMNDPCWVIEGTDYPPGVFDSPECAQAALDEARRAHDA
jgi:hypothetical protein